jgi:methionine sulfoxide reductase heme-binding subunit
MNNGRMQRRLFRHHMPLFVLSATLVSVLTLLIRSEQLLFRLSIATAYIGLLLLSATLLVGPVRVLRGRSSPIASNDLRRDIGIWAGIMSLSHVAIGLQVHLGSMLLYFFRQIGPDKLLTVRLDFFGLANYVGLIATLVVALLLSLSNDCSLRRLGAHHWKSLQRWNYLCFVLIALHGAIYQVIEKRKLPYPIVLGATLVVVAVLQWSAFRNRQLRRAMHRRTQV